MRVTGMQATVEFKSNVTVSITALIGGSKAIYGDYSLVVGALSSVYNPLPKNVVVYDGKVYDADFDVYGSQASGALGDVQSRVRCNMI